MTSCPYSICGVVATAVGDTPTRIAGEAPALQRSVSLAVEDPRSEGAAEPLLRSGQAGAPSRSWRFTTQLCHISRCGSPRGGLQSLVAFRDQSIPEFVQEEVDFFVGRERSHDADAEDFSGEWAEAACDFDAMFFQ